MKKLFSGLFLAAATIVAVNADTVRGGGKVAYGEFDISLTYNELYVARGIKVVLVDSTVGVGKIAADEALLGHVSITERDGHVRVTYTPSSINPRSPIETVVTIPMSRTLRDLNASSAGKIVGETPLKTSDVEIDASSAGSVNIVVESSIVDVDLSSAAQCTVAGTTRDLDVDVSSAAQFHGLELATQNSVAEASSGASARLTVERSVRARASSGGSIRYSGTPSQSDVHSSSGGSVRRID